MAVQEKRLAAAGAGEPRDELGPSLEAHSGHVQRLALELRSVELDELGLGARSGEPVCEVGLELLLLPRRVVRLPRGRVEADQVGREPDELVASTLDLLADPLFEISQWHGREIYSQ